MYKVILQESAQNSLDKIQKSDFKIFNKIISALNELRLNGFKSTSVKKLSNSTNIFRKRMGRFRILFTIESNIIDVWVIEIEKDTKKDYKRWLKYIEKYS